MKRLQKGDQSYGVHMSHCNQGENKLICKYGEDNICPMIEDEKPMAFREDEIKQLALNLIHELNANIKEDGLIHVIDITPQMAEIEQYFDERDMR